MQTAKIMIPYRAAQPGREKFIITRASEHQNATGMQYAILHHE
ncbi:hypothetical protein [Nitrosospira briensis]|nr:hypothetical protein [Nitrosospira briensis]